MLTVTESKRKENSEVIWIARINAAARLHGMSYSELMGRLNKANIELNRKVLADLAMNHPSTFETLVNKVK